MASTPASWDTHKELLSNLYRDQNLSRDLVVEHMKTHHGFIRSAGQYERQFNKWGWGKYAGAVGWRCVDFRMRKRKRAGLESEVVLHGTVQSSKKIRREIRRHVPELIAYPEDGPSPQMPPGIQVRTPLAISCNSFPEEPGWMPSKFSTHIEDSLSLVLPPETKLPSFIGLKVLQEAFLSRMMRDRFEQVDESVYPVGGRANLDFIADTPENQLLQSSRSIAHAPGFHIGVWCNTGVLPNDASAECDIVRQSNALLSTFDMFTNPMPDLGVEKSTLEHYQMLRRFFVLNTSKQLRPRSKELKSLLPLLKGTLIQAFLKELVSEDKIAGQDFVETLLHSAICAKDSSIVASLLQLGCDPNRQVLDGKEKKSLLRLAAGTGSLSVVKILVRAGAKVNGMPPEGHGVASPLITAVNGQFLNVAEYLLQRKSRVACNNIQHYNCAALAAAAQRGTFEMARILLTAYTHVKCRQRFLDTAVSKLAKSYDARSDQDGRNEILKVLLAGGANPEPIVYQETVGKSNSGRWPDDGFEDDSDDNSDDDSELSCEIRLWTALEVSAERGHLDFVATLLENGARVSERVVLAAIESRHADLACFLLGKMECGSLSHPRGYEMLRTATDHRNAGENIDLVRALLKAGAKPNKYLQEAWGAGSSKDSDKESDCDSVVEDILNSKYRSSETSPLEIAAERGNAKLLDLLLSAGAWVIPPEHPHYNLQFERPTILDRGAESGNIEVLERLLEAGADVPSSRAALVHVIEKLQNPELVWRLIQGGIDVNKSITKQGSNTTTALQAAVRIGNVAIMQMLLDAGDNKNPVKPDTNDGLRWSALRDAIEAQDQDLINILLQSGADVNNPPGESDRNTALEAAVINEDMNLVFRLLQLGSDPNDSQALLAAAMPQCPAAFLDVLLRSSVSASRSPHYGCAALQIAIRIPDYARVQRLLQAGVRCDQPASESGYSFQTTTGQPVDIYWNLSALGSALKVDQGQCGPILRLVFAAGRNPNALVDHHLQHTGLQFAIAGNNCSLAQFMIVGGADVNFGCPEGDWKGFWALRPSGPICMAVAGGHTEMVTLLLSSGARVDAKDNTGRSLLTMAASGGNMDIVQTLLDADAAVNTDGSNFMCPALSAAARHGSADIVQRLLQAGANASGITPKRDSPALCHAVAGGYLQTVCILLEAGADANASANSWDIDIFDADWYDDEDDDEDDDEPFRENMSAIQICAAMGSIHIAALLVRRGADVNTRARVSEDCSLKTLRRMRRKGKWLPPLSPLEEAAARGNLNMLQLLLDFGARTHGDGARQYKRALGYARRTCNHAAVKLLEKHHAVEGALRQLNGVGGVSGLQGGSEVFP